MSEQRQQLIRSLFDEYIAMYARRDERLLERFSENFSGYTGGGNFLVHNREEWLQITRQDFAQVKGSIDIEMLDLKLQDISDEVVAATAFFHIRLPIPDHILARETARLVLIFRREAADWKIVHSGISIPYHLVQDGEVYPIKGLAERNSELEALVEERTRALEAANSKLEALSYSDGLTGIANRRSFDRTLALEWQRGCRAGTPLGLLLIDADHFKHFNDLYGHQAGDACLQALAATLVNTGRRAGDLAARYGGEEFAVLLPDTGTDKAMQAARRIQNDVRRLALPHAQTRPGVFTVSLGVASMLPAKDGDPQELVRQADVALYRAKRSGRDCMQLAGGDECA